MKKKQSNKCVTGTDKRGHEVKMYQLGNTWYVERNNNGAVHPEPCKSEGEAKKLFTEFVQMD